MGKVSQPHTSAGKSGRQIIFAVILVGVTLTVIEILCWAYTSFFGGPFRQDLDPSLVTRDGARQAIESKTFDTLLGWRNPQITRSAAQVGSEAWAQSYGDSFTFCSEVEPEDSWQRRFAKLSGKTILNMGVPGYGLDQAILAFERYGKDYPASHVILGLNRHLYRRAHSYYSWHFFEHSYKFLYVFKPIFIELGGAYRLIPPPCDNPQCLERILKLGEPTHEQFLRGHDYWYRQNLARPINAFPHAFTVFNLLKLKWQDRHRSGDPRYQYFVDDQRSFKLVHYLLERFAAQCRGSGQTPLFLLLYAPSDLEAMKRDGRGDGQLIDYLAQKKYAVVDTSAYIFQQRPRDSAFEDLAAPEGHFNARGNELIARALFEWVSAH